MTDGRTGTSRPLGKYGRAVEASDGMLHVEGADALTLCGKAIECYPLHWDTKTVVACGSCLIAAGVPFGKAAERG